MRTIVIATILALLTVSAHAETRSIYHPDDLTTARVDLRESRRSAAQVRAEEAERQRAATAAEARRPRECQPWFHGRAKCEPLSYY
jgi:hypothetical protein